MRAFEFFTKITESTKETPKADAMAAALDSAVTKAEQIVAKLEKKVKSEKQPQIKQNPINNNKKIPLPSEKSNVESLDEAAKDTKQLIFDLEGRIKSLNEKASKMPVEFRQIILSDVKPMSESLQSLRKTYAEELAAERVAGGEDERAANEEFINNLNSDTLPKLAEKIYNELEKISEHSAGASTASGGLPSKIEKQISAKREGDLKVIQGKIVSGLQGVFSKIKDSAILEGPKSRAAVTELLNDFIAGVVDFGKVLQLKSGNIDKMMRDQMKARKKTPEYAQAFEDVRDSLYNQVIEIGQGTNMGPGELGLALILQPASKAGKGDLGYGDQVIELKGSKKAKSGARLGLEMGKTAKLIPEYQRVLDKHFGKGKVLYSQKIEGKKNPVQLNLTIQGIGYLNNFIKNTPGFNTKEFLVDAILTTLQNAEQYRKIVEGHDGLDKAINADGTIDYNNWVKELTLLQYELYGGKEAGKSQFKTIMVFSPTSSNFRVVKNAKEFAAAIDDGQSGKERGIILSGGLSFNLDKFQKTAQVGIESIY